MTIIGPEVAQRTVLVSQVPHDATNDDLREFFAICGEVVTVIHAKAEPFALVTFRRRSAASVATQLNGGLVCFDPICVDFFNPSVHSRLAQQLNHAISRLPLDSVEDDDLPSSIVELAATPPRLRFSAPSGSTPSQRKLPGSSAISSLFRRSRSPVEPAAPTYYSTSVSSPSPLMEGSNPSTMMEGHSGTYWRDWTPQHTEDGAAIAELTRPVISHTPHSAETLRTAQLPGMYIRSPPSAASRNSLTQEEGLGTEHRRSAPPVALQGRSVFVSPLTAPDAHGLQKYLCVFGEVEKLGLYLASCFPAPHNEAALNPVEEETRGAILAGDGADEDATFVGIAVFARGAQARNATGLSGALFLGKFIDVRMLDASLLAAIQLAHVNPVATIYPSLQEERKVVSAFWRQNASGAPSPDAAARVVERFVAQDNNSKRAPARRSLWGASNGTKTSTAKQERPTGHELGSGIEHKVEQTSPPTSVEDASASNHDDPAPSSSVGGMLGTWWMRRRQRKEMDRKVRDEGRRHAAPKMATELSSSPTSPPSLRCSPIAAAEEAAALHGTRPAKSSQSIPIPSTRTTWSTQRTADRTTAVDDAAKVEPEEDPNLVLSVEAMSPESAAEFDNFVASAIDVELATMAHEITRQTSAHRLGEALSRPILREEDRARLLAGPICTYVPNRGKRAKQLVYNCLSCFPEKGQAVCFYCAALCHAGHQLSDQREALSFCDCGAFHTFPVDCVAGSLCSSTKYAGNVVLQNGYSCMSCGYVGSAKLLCESCALRCHLGHQTVYAGRVKMSCPCGGEQADRVYWTCRAMGNPVTKDVDPWGVDRGREADAATQYFDDC